MQPTGLINEWSRVSDPEALISALNGLEYHPGEYIDGQLSLSRTAKILSVGQLAAHLDGDTQSGMTEWKHIDNFYAMIERTKSANVTSYTIHTVSEDRKFRDIVASISTDTPGFLYADHNDDLTHGLQIPSWQHGAGLYRKLVAIRAFCGK